MILCPACGVAVSGSADNYDDDYWYLAKHIDEIHPTSHSWHDWYCFCGDHFGTIGGLVYHLKSVDLKVHYVTSRLQKHSSF